jgi:hypothetical protein
MQRSFPWELVERIGVSSRGVAQQVANATQKAVHRPPVETIQNWYY